MATNEAIVIVFLCTSLLYLARALGTAGRDRDINQGLVYLQLRL